MASMFGRLASWVGGLVRTKRAYEAASPRDQWRPKRAGASANADHQADAATIRAKARAIVHNVPYIESGLAGLVTQTIGTGLTPRATGHQAKQINDVLDAWFKLCDADGVCDFFGLQSLAYRAMEQDGEVLIRLRRRRPSDGLPIPLQIQILEIDWLDSTKNGPIGGNEICGGIEYDALGKVSAYWLYESHPGDGGLNRRFRNQSRRVEASDIVHLFERKRPGQGRGISRFAPIIVRTRDLQLYEDAEQARKNLEARLGALASPDPSVMANPASDGVPMAASDVEQTGSLGELSSGGITRLPPGTTVTMVEPKAAQGYEAYVKLQLHIIAAGMGITYEMMIGDVSEVNFSSARVRLLDFRRSVEAMRWLTLIPRFQVVIDAAMQAGALAGSFSGAQVKFDWSTPKWDYVNPQQDVAADISEISVGLASVSEKLRMRGYKPEDVAREIAEDKKRYENLGILDLLLFKEKGSLPATESSSAGSRMDSIAASLARIDARMTRAERLARGETLEPDPIPAAAPDTGVHGYRIVKIGVDPKTGLAREFAKIPLTKEEANRMIAADTVH